MNIFLHKENYYLLYEYISKHLIDMNNLILIKSLNNSIPEVSFDFTKNKIGDININLYFNQTLNNERMKLESNIQPYSNKILIVFIDSISKANSQRQLKKNNEIF